MSMPNDELEQLMKQLNGKNKVVAESFFNLVIGETIVNCQESAHVAEYINDIK